MDREIPAEVQEALARGRAAYVRADYVAAGEADQQALALAERLESRAGIARATRLLGVVDYRLGRATLSYERLKRAQELARELGWEREELLCCNHLGGTLRKLGWLEEADETLRGALQRAHTSTHLEVRARLMGSYGAYLDDLGEGQAAAEHYARHEELLQMMDDPGRLANAHGLVSRAARLRGDLQAALSKARDEQRLGERVGHPLREGRGWLHMAQAHAAMGDAEQAEHAFLRAADVLGRDSAARTPIEIATARGRFYLSQGRLVEAYDQVGQAILGLRSLGDDEHEHAAKVEELSAEIAAAVGLHGEALWHLKTALEHHLTRFGPIADPSLKERTKGRRQQLVRLAARLRSEAGEVTRESKELEEVEQLVRRLDPDQRAEVSDERISLAAWRERVRERGTLRWERLLTKQYFSQLMAESRADLVLADVVYQGPVDDLKRSLLLIFTSIERELRRVVGAAIVSQRHPKSLGPLVQLLLGQTGSRPDSAERRLVQALTAQYDLSPLRIFEAELSRVDGQRTAKLTTIRNAVAHGNPLQLTRLDVDAICRALTLEPKPLLPLLARLPNAEAG